MTCRQVSQEKYKTAVSARHSHPFEHAKKSCILKRATTQDFIIYVWFSYSTVMKGDSKVLLSKVITQRCRGGCNSFPKISPLSFDHYLMMLIVKQ